MLNAKENPLYTFSEFKHLTKIKMFHCQLFHFYVLYDFTNNKPVKEPSVNLDSLNKLK